MVLTFLSSCTEEESISNEAVEDANSEEVAEIVAGALAEDAQGMAAQFKASAFEAEEVEFDGDTAARVEQNVCGQEFSDNFELESPENQAIFYDYSMEYFYAVECNEFMIPNFLDFSLTQSGVLDAPRFGSMTTSAGNWVLSGLEVASTEYTFAGNYQREGEHASKVRNLNTYQFDLSIGFTDVKMDKGNYVISQGTGSLSVSAEVSDGSSFAAEGSIEFKGNQEAVLTINGESFLIDIGSCGVTPI